MEVFFCTVSINEYKTGTDAFKFRPAFTLTQDTDSCSVLYKILNYFNCGYINHNSQRDSSEYKCTSLSDISNIIIPHFKAFPVFDDKLHAFSIFVEIVNLLIFVHNNTLTSAELTEKYLQILNLTLSMNKSSQRSEERKEYLFSLLGGKYDLSSLNLPTDSKIDLSLTSQLTTDFISGWIDGDSSFSIGFAASGKLTPLFEINFDGNSHGLIAEIRKLIGEFAIKNGITNEDVTVSNRYLVDIHNVGSINQNSSIFKLSLSGTKLLNKLIIPWLDEFINLHTIKASHYGIWREVLHLISLDRGFKGEAGKERFFKIVDLAYNMNKGGKNRNISKEDYISLMLLTKFKGKDN